MAKIQRPLDSDAVSAADDQLYAAYENDPRPNPLFDADGNRLNLSATDPKQADLRDEWCDLYQAALDTKKKAADSTDNGDGGNDGGDDTPSDPPCGSNNVGDPATPCTTLEWIKIRLIRLADAQPRPQWWRPGGKAGPYPSEPCTVELTNGTEKGSLDGNGVTEHANLPAGVCSIHFTRFYKALEQMFGPEDTWPEIQPRGAGAGAAGAAAAPAPDTVVMAEVAEVVKASDGTDNNEAPANRDQYINMPAANGHPELGRSVRLKARLKWSSGANNPLNGQKVYWYFKPDAKNRASLPAALQAGFDTAGTAQFTSTTAADGWTPIVHFIPSQYGGDNFEVYATTDAGFTGGLAAGDYTVWRRVFYELDCMKRPDAGTYADRADTAGMQVNLKADFVDCVQTGTDDSPDHVRMIGEHEVAAWATKYRNGTGAPRYYHLLLIDTIAWDPSVAPLTKACGAGNDTITLPAAHYLLKAGAWFVSATYRQGTATGSIPAANFTLSETGDPSNGSDAFVISVSWNTIPVDPSQTVHVRLSFTNWIEGSGLQVSPGPATIIGVRGKERGYRASPDDVSKAALNTMLHEPGHAMGLAPKTHPDGTSNPNQYNKGGSHCSALSNGCVMYEANSPSTDFCTDCNDGLRGRNLASLPIDGNAGY